ncbi:MAG: NAD(+) synthase [Firmicutes bacterium]|jgi:NAD+ synthase|nr:NAD(+) synthase [Bacillota bacterium]
MVSIEKKIDIVVNWLREVVKESGTNGLIVGLSGGIDSSVVSFLIKKAFPEDSMGVILPCKSNDKDKADAEAVAKACDIDYTEVDLSDTHDLLMGKVDVAMGDRNRVNMQLTDANLRARLRMSTLYTIANSKNYLVVGTDNAAELLTGYFTKYGDGGVDILPIAGLTKREVFEWAKHLGVPQSVIDRKPSAGLWEGQTDEDEMGTTYDLIDDYIEGKEIPEKDKAIIERMNKRSEHKRVMPSMPPKFQ